MTAPTTPFGADYRGHRIEPVNEREVDFWRLGTSEVRTADTWEDAEAAIDGEIGHG